MQNIGFNLKQMQNRSISTIKQVIIWNCICVYLCLCLDGAYIPPPRKVCPYNLQLSCQNNCMSQHCNFGDVTKGTFVSYCVTGHLIAVLYFCLIAGEHTLLPYCSFSLAHWSMLRFWRRPRRTLHITLKGRPFCLLVTVS